MHVTFLELLESRRLFSSLVPGVVASEFLFDNGPQRIVVQFDTDVSASLSAADLQVQNHSTLRRVPSPTTRYTATILPNTQVQGVQFFVSAAAMNDSAMVVGRVYGFPGGHLSTGSWAWQPGNANLAEAPGNGVTPTDIANNGTTVGSHYLMNRVAVRWGVGLPYHELGKLNSATITQYAAYGVNDLNQVVGQDDFPGAGFPTGPRGVNWLSGAGSVQSVGGRVISAINNNGDMIGDGPTFYPAGGSAITIGTGGGVATKMNEAGEVVGAMGTWTRNDSFFVTTGKPFYWNQSMSDPFMLELPGNQTNIHPRGINNAGQIVGSGQGLIWHEGMPYNINTLLAPGTNVPTISGIVDINNNGQMITSNQPPILLTPVTAAVEDKPSSNVPQRPVRAMSAKAERVATTASLSTARVIDDLEI